MKLIKLYGILLLLPLSGLGEVSTPNYTLHSVFIAQFLKYIEWPREAVTTGEIVIGVVANAEATEELTKVAANKTIGGLKVVVRGLSSANQTSTCHLVFMPYSASSYLPEVMDQTRGKSVVLITEKAGLIKKGSYINFIVREGKIAFEIQRQLFAESKLKISTELLNLAIIE